MTNVNMKEEARRLIEKLPDNSTWDNLMYEIYVRQTVEAGLKDSEKCKITSVEQLRQQLK